VTAKKKVKSKAALNKMALATGATITDSGGRHFNTQKKKAPTQTKIAPPFQKVEKQDPAAEPVQAEADPGSKLLAEKVEAASKASVLILAELSQQIAQIQMQAALPPTEWVFDFVRGEDGFITRVKATAVPQVKQLNS